MKILVTGGAGFIGSHLVDSLIERGDEVLVVDDLSSGREKNLNLKAKFFKLDIKSLELENIFKAEKPELVFHLAAQKSVSKSVEDPMFDAEINILGSLNLLENCRKYGVKKFIFSSTGGAIYGEPTGGPQDEKTEEKPISPYGITKLSLEKYLYFYEKQYGLEWSAMRFANVYGPRQDPLGEAGVVAVFISKLLKKEQTIINGEGTQTRDFVYVGDVVEATLLASKSKINGSFNIGTAVENTVNDLFRKIREVGGFESEEKHGPGLKGEQMRSVLSYEKANKELGFTPKINLEEGLYKTVEWFRNQG